MTLVVAAGVALWVATWRTGTPAAAEPAAPAGAPAARVQAWRRGGKISASFVLCTREPTVPVSWPAGGPWALATTSTAVDWQPAAVALAAAAQVRVAALIFGSGAEPGPRLLGELATCLRAGDGGADPLSVDEAAALVHTLARTHGLVLVIGLPGLLVPVGRAGWTLMDLAVAVSAPVVVVTGTGPDAANHTTLALGAVAGHGLAATVITDGGPLPTDVTPGAEPVRDGDEADAGTAAEAETAAEVRTTAGTPPPAPPSRSLPPPATARDKRVVLLLAAAFVLMSLVVCGLAIVLPGQTVHTEATLTPVTGHRAPGGARPVPVPGTPAAPAPRPSPVAVAEICPQYRGRVIPTVPDRATTERVTAAWQRIEVWLAAKAPASRRSLGPPAAAKEINAAQRRMSVAFPADLVASLRRHDGITDRGTGFTFPYFYEPLRAGRIADEWLMLCTSLADVRGAADSGWWDRALVPFASSGDGGNLHVDQRPAGHGRVGEFYNEDGVSYREWPGSVAELLEQTADSLETGRPFRNRYRPTVTGQGVLDWDVI